MAPTSISELREDRVQNGGTIIIPKVRRFFRCPWCNQLLSIEVDSGLKADRWPVKMDGRHGDHDYTVFLDSQFGVTDVRKKPRTNN